MGEHCIPWRIPWRKAAPYAFAPRSSVIRPLAYVTLSLLMSASASSRAEEIDAGVAALADRYVQILREGDAEAYRELHATYLERCSDPGTLDAYEALLSLELESRPADPPGLEVSVVEPARLEQGKQLLAAAAGVSVRHPDPPGYAIEISLRGPYARDHPCYAEDATRRVRKYVAKGPDHWYLGAACLTDTAIVALRARRRDAGAVRRMQEDLYSSLDPELRAELLELLEERRGSEAVDRYQSRAGASKGAAVRLVERLCEEL